jgi:hypothetical protein
MAREDHDHHERRGRKREQTRMGRRVFGTLFPKSDREVRRKK